MDVQFPAFSQAYKESKNLETYSPYFSVLSSFAIDSSRLETLSTEKKIEKREDFFGCHTIFSPPPLMGVSRFVSKEMVEHLMRNKKNSALGVKYVVGDQITNMEGALHTFVTPICSIFMTGDYKWVGHLEGRSFGGNQARNVILSAAIHPDFEFDNVIMPVVKIQKESIEGSPFKSDRIPSSELKADKTFREEYEKGLLKGMIYHLSKNHRLPSLSEISLNQIMSVKETQDFLEQALNNSEEVAFQDLYMRLGQTVVSLEILFQIYMEQIRNEFKVLNIHAPQGYVYTISPPSIFARSIGGAAILNHLQALAFRSLSKEDLFSHMHVLGFSDYADKGMTALLRKALPRVSVVSQSSLFNASGVYSGPEGLALVIHNNSDGFGQNIETEGTTSLDGVIGSFSNAASILQRDRADLLDFLFFE